MKRLLLPLLAALALPTDVNANPFSKDITFKTPLGEKYIIKGKSINRMNMNQDDFIKLKIIDNEIINNKKIEVLDKSKNKNFIEINKLEEEIKKVNAYGYINNLLYEECLAKKTLNWGLTKEYKKHVDNCKKEKANNLFYMNKERRAEKSKPFKDQIAKIELKNKKIDEKIANVLSQQKEDENYLKENLFTRTHVQTLLFKPIYVDLNKQKTIMSEFAAFCINPKLGQEEKLFWEGKKLLNDEYNDQNLSSLIEGKVCKKYAKFN